MLNFRNRLGKRVNQRLRREQVIWLTTVDSDDAPQPRPVWFHWDGRTVLIFSEKDKAKLRHIAFNPRVALHFNTDAEGGDVAVIIGDAHILKRGPGRARVQSYLRKYGKGIGDLEMTIEEFKDSFAVPIQVIPRRVRGAIE